MSIKFSFKKFMKKTSLGPDKVILKPTFRKLEFPENIITPLSTIDNAITVKLCLLTTLVSVEITVMFHFLRTKTGKIR